jgi:hypothetical protein
VDRRLRYALITALVAVAVAATAFVATRDDGHPLAVAVGDRGDAATTTTVASDATSSSSADDSSTTAAPSSTTTSTAPRGRQTTTTAAPATASTTTTTIASAPRPGGGASVHRCAQVNTLTADGLSAQVCQEGASVAGSPTSLHITASDGDAKVDNDCRSPDVEWGDEPSVRCMIACHMSDQPSGPSSIDITRDHTYAKAGTYHVSVTVESNCGAQPYGESHTLELDLVLTDPASPPDGTG